MTIVAGVDEVGRGALAGPVVAAACILPAEFPRKGIADSKKLTPAQREEVYASLLISARFHIAFIEASEVDAINILQASLKAMRMALLGLMPGVDYALVDGNRLPEALPCPALPVIKGDIFIPCISAASILAKVTRDRWMGAMYPEYGFARHKGYGTKEHWEALEQFGPIEGFHRKSFLR